MLWINFEIRDIVRELMKRVLEPQSVLILPNFFAGAKALRRNFDSRFENPKAITGERFVWDYWHIPEQYTLLRTPAYLFFPEPIYRRFHERMVKWGRETLGCHDITPTWLSCYVDGCEQKIHADVPHGPWAFVYSLTPWAVREFTGGETFLLSDDVLNYWARLQKLRTLESPQASRLIEPHFNQLAIFDPRIPHGVRKMSGVSDVCKGRLVIHGWFANPRPFIRGPVTAHEFQSRIDDLSEKLSHSDLFSSGANGTLSFRIQISAAGQVRPPKLLTHTLRSFGANDAEITEGVRSITQWISKWSFGKKKMPSTITLPLQFD